MQRDREYMIDILGSARLNGLRITPIVNHIHGIRGNGIKNQGILAILPWQDVNDDFQTNVYWLIH